MNQLSNTLFENHKSNNFSQQKEKIIVNSTTFPSKEYIISKIEPIIKYYSEAGYFINIKNHLDEEIPLGELVEQYFGNVHEYFEELEDNNISDSASTKEEEVQEEKESKP